MNLDTDNLVNNHSPDYDWKLDNNFIESVENDPYLAYADTDSSYQIYTLPFSKHKVDNRKIVNYVQDIASELRASYNEALEYFGQFANLNPKFNTMDFKSEVVGKKGFFNAKKFYSLHIIWDEGTYFDDEPYLKITGGQLKKSDVTPITKDLLEEIYNILVIDLSIVDPVYIYKFIFKDLRKKYTDEILEQTTNMNFKRFAIPKKWGSTKKSIPPFVYGAMLYNALISDSFRPSDSFIVVKINIEPHMLIEYFKNNDIINNAYTLQLEHIVELKEKLNVISIPPDMTEDEKTKLLKLMTDLHIKLDIDDLIRTNIDQKLEVFDKLFTSDVKLTVG